MNERCGDERGISDALGAIVLVSVITLGISIAAIAILSGPPPQKVPALSADITNTSDTVHIRHAGGDTLIRGEYRILADGVDRTSAFLSGGTVPERWSVGEELRYRIPAGSEIPKSIQIIAVIGSREQMILQVQIRPPAPGPSVTVSPTATTTATTTIPTTSPTATPTTTATPAPCSVVKFVLMYAQTASPGLRNTVVPGFDPIPDGAVIQPSQYNSQPITIRAITEPLPTGSVRLVLAGPAARTQMENVDPYCLFGDDPQWQYNPWIPTPPVYGSYRLTGTPYTGTAGSGTAGTPLSINFTLAPPPVPLTIFSDNFDAVFSGWSTAGGSGDVDRYTGTPHNGAAGIHLRDDGQMQRVIPTTAYSGITVSFTMGANSLESGEFVVAEWSPDGTTWTVLKQINNGDPEEDNALHPFSYSLPVNAADNPLLSLRFRTDGNNNNDDGYVDDIVVSGIPS